MKPFQMNNAVNLLWELLPQFIGEGDTVVDATVGNGRDTEGLCRLVGQTGTVIGFDIQEEALQRAQTFLQDAVPDHSVRLIRRCHSELADHVAGPVSLVLFNLGYLPGGDKAVTTRAETTLEAMAEGLDLLKPGGKLAAVLYSGHPEGNAEAEVVKAWANGLDQKHYTTVLMQFANQVNHPPQLLLIERRA